MGRTCEQEGCISEAAPGRKRCWACLKSEQRDRQVKALVERPSTKLVRLAVRLADCDPDDDHEYRDRKRDLLRAARRYSKGA